MFVGNHQTDSDVLLRDVQARSTSGDPGVCTAPFSFGLSIDTRPLYVVIFYIVPVYSASQLMLHGAELFMLVGHDRGVKTSKQASVWWWESLFYFLVLSSFSSSFPS